jgi:hypothetical protein
MSKMDTSTSTAPHSSLRRQTFCTPSSSSFVPSGSPAIAQEKKSFRAKAKTADPIVVDLTADSDDDEAIPQRKFDFKARIAIPAVDMASDSGVTSLHYLLPLARHPEFITHHGLSSTETST